MFHLIAWEKILILPCTDPGRTTMSVKITQIEGTQFKAEADGFEIRSGRIDAQTLPDGMSPGKLLTASLGLCSAFHAALYLKRNDIYVTELVLSVEAVNEKVSSRASQFNIEIKVGASLTESQVQDLSMEIQRCYVGNTLKGNPKISYRVKTL